MRLRFFFVFSIVGHKIKADLNLLYRYALTNGLNAALRDKVPFASFAYSFRPTSRTARKLEPADILVLIPPLLNRDSKTGNRPSKKVKASKSITNRRLIGMHYSLIVTSCRESLSTCKLMNLLGLFLHQGNKP